jgi:hypothetical protein
MIIYVLDTIMPYALTLSLQHAKALPLRISRHSFISSLVGLKVNIEADFSDCWYYIGLKPVNI